LNETTIRFGAITLAATAAGTPGAVGEDGVGRQTLLQPVHDLAHLDRAFDLGRRRPFEIVGARRLGLIIPRPCRDGAEGLRHGGEFCHAGVDRQRSLIDAAKLLRTRMDMD
jgi:hypothetical protein